MKLRYLKYALLALFVAYFAACSDDDSKDPIIPEPPTEETDYLPKKELRGVWLTTAWGKDWPQKETTVEGQKALYIKYLDLLAENNFNAVFVQVRSMADAFYESEYEPLNKNLLTTPDGKLQYDVMGFMIEEAHKRNIEFHAWINPYRIATSEDGKFADLDEKINPELVKTYDKIQIYNPALPEVRDLLANIVNEILTKYDVDGIHIDDYFYPDPSTYSKSKLQDEDDYAKYGTEYATISDFRFGNVNKMVQKLHEVVKAKPGVVFSVSPGGNPSSNNAIYADVSEWCKQGWMDMLVPQIYFPTGVGSTDGTFNYRVHWFCQYAYEVPVLVGYGLYKFEEADKPAAYNSPQELQKQFDFASTRPRVHGGLMYTASTLVNNPVDVMSVIKKQYAAPAVRPVFGTPTLAKPVIPANVAVAAGKLTWTVEKDLYYAIYQDMGEGEVAKLITITNSGSYDLSEKGSYFMTAINRDNTESDKSGVVVY